jgi:hypothetical protein
MTNYNVVFDEKQYREVSKRAARYYQETAKTAVIPKIYTTEPDALEYVYTGLTNPKGSHGELDWTAGGRKADVIHEPTTYYLDSLQLDIEINKNDISNYGSQLIADKNDAAIAKWALDWDDAMLHGVKNDVGYQLREGLIGQLTSMENLNGTDSSLATKGYIWKAINKMIDGIPFAMREEGPDMVLMMDELCYAKATAPDRIYNDKVEWNFIYDMLMGEMAKKGRKIGQVILTNKVLAEAADDTDGDNADTVDTLGTHSRMLLFVPDPRWIAIVMSRSFSLVDETTIPLAVHQIWGVRGNCCVFNTNCAEYTEALVWT